MKYGTATKGEKHKARPKKGVKQASDKKKEQKGGPKQGDRGTKGKKMQTVTWRILVQALLVQSALSAMKQQRESTNPRAQHSLAGSQQLNNGTELAQLRAEYETHMAAAAEKAEKVRTWRPSPPYSQHWQSKAAAFVSVSQHQLPLPCTMGALLSCRLCLCA